MSQSKSTDQQAQAQHYETAATSRTDASGSHDDDEQHRLRPSFDSTREGLLHAGSSVKRKAMSVWEGFSDFALRDNVLEVATGLIIAAAFTAVVTSFVSDILTPILGLIPSVGRNLDEKFAVLRKGPSFHQEHGYNTLKQARDDGAVVLAYGAFFNKLLDFMGIGLTLYGLANFYAWVSKESIIKHTKRCKYCRKSIGMKAQRCINCTSWQDGREDVLH